MVPLEVRCWGQYLSWQFTIGLCATLARSRNERPDTFACFLWPTQYRMGRAYSLQKLNGRVVAGGFAVGKTPALSARRNRRMPVKEDRKSTRLNSSHVSISYAVFCLKKKTITQHDAAR